MGNNLCGFFNGENTDNNDADFSQQNNNPEIKMKIIEEGFAISRNRLNCNLCNLCLTKRTRKTKDYNLSNLINDQEVINLQENEEILSNQNKDKKLNKNIIINPQKDTIEKPIINNEDNPNKTFNYTQNIINNNIIQLNPSDKINLDNIDNKINSMSKGNIKNSIDKNKNKDNLSNSSMEKRSQKSNKNKSKNQNIENKENNDNNIQKININNSSISSDKDKEIIIDSTDYDIQVMGDRIQILLSRIDHKKIDQIIYSISASSLDQLIAYFKNNSKKLSDVEKAWLVYKWETLNIEYDFAGVNDKNYDIEPEATFKRGKSICSGYSKLYKKICDNLDLIVEYIGGHSKGFNYEITDKFEKSESHAWNVIKIKNIWYFVETTWGAGYTEDHKTFIKRFTPYYFLTPPIQFIRGHFPDNPKWQLLPDKDKIDQKKFMEFLDLKNTFYDLEFKSVEPDNSFNNVNEKGNIKIYFNEKKDEKLNVTASLKYFEIEKTGKVNYINLMEIENSILVVRKNGFFEINYILNKKGKYKLEIFGSEGGTDKLLQLCQLILISQKDISTPITYPKTFGLYTSSDLQIISPLSCPLFNGDKINFEYKTNDFTNLHIGIKDSNDNNHFIELEKHENIFKEEDILIYGQKVSLSTMKEKEGKNNTYNTILEYSVQNNPRNKTMITFPQSFSGPKNKLIEPICSSLKRGQNVNFKIKSDDINKIIVLDGKIRNDLEKNNNIFSGSIKISGNEVLIAYITNESKLSYNYGVLYKYNVN